MNFVRNRLQPGATFVDVGSNKGDFSLLAAKTVGSNGKVLSFEPEPRNCYWIRRSIQASGYENIKLYEFALSGTDGTALLHLGRKSGWHTLVPECPDRDQGVIGVVTKRLDSVLEEADQSKVDMIKIDVEGAELEVLKGARGALSNNNDLVLLMDLHPYLGVDVAEVFKILEELDFRVYKVQPPFNIPASGNRQLSEVLAYRGRVQAQIIRER
jgi:FkbM family methyltransferase